MANFTGTAANEIFNGTAFDDTAQGNGGNDTLQLGASGLATIVGYAHGQDHFSLDDAIFTQLGAPGTLSAGAFVLGTAAFDANDRILFDSASGNVSYDADGSGAGAAVVFATIQNLLGGALDQTDFIIV